MALYLVTGGAGFIGSHVTEALVTRGERVRVLDNFTTGKRDNLEHLPVEILAGDVRASDDVQSAMRDVDFVIHQAAVVSVAQSMIDPVTTHEVNVTGTLNVLVAARQSGIRHLVFASSCAVYGDNSELPLRESSAVRPLSPYAASKLAGEMYCQTFQQAYGLPTTCLRYFNVYGPRQDPSGDYAAVIPKFAQRIRAGQAPIIYGDGNQTRDFVHVSDIVRANLAACGRSEAIGRVINVASGRQVSLLDLIEGFGRLHGRPIELIFTPSRAGDILHSVGDNRCLQALGVPIMTPLEQGLAQL
jgi:nucleoside-diphosphate-sugar epimerase